MNRKLQVAVGLVALLVIALCLALQATIRFERAHKFAEVYQAQTYGGTNYVVQLLETTVGRIDSGYALVLDVRLENPSPGELVVDRNWFVLADHDRNYYLPSTTGTQTPSIKLPPHGVAEKEMLSYALNDGAIAGSLVLRIGLNQWVVVKGDKPFTKSLRRGEFRSFRRRDW